MSAFSLVETPRLLTLPLLRRYDAPLPLPANEFAGNPELRYTAYRQKLLAPTFTAGVAIAQARGLSGSSAGPPSRSGSGVNLRSHQAFLELRQPVRSSRPSRPLESLSARPLSIWPSAPGPFPPPLRLSARTGLVFHLGLSALSGTRGPLFRREKQAGS